jgi:hypothetical protein
MNIREIRRLIHAAHIRIHWLRQNTQYISDDPLESDILELRLALLAEKKREVLAHK